MCYIHEKTISGDGPSILNDLLQAEGALVYFIVSHIEDHNDPYLHSTLIIRGILNIVSQNDHIFNIVSSEAQSKGCTVSLLYHNKPGDDYWSILVQTDAPANDLPLLRLTTRFRSTSLEIGVWRPVNEDI